MLYLISTVVILLALIHFASQSAKPKFHISEAGNKTLLHKGMRLTIFPNDQQKRSWKYCLAAEGSESEPYFSESYELEDEAINAGLADLMGEEIKALSRKEKRRDAEERHWASAEFKQEMKAKTIDYTKALEKRRVIVSKGLETNGSLQKFNQQYEIARKEMRLVQNRRLLAIDSDNENEDELSQIVDGYLDLMAEIQEAIDKS